ncbi:hypothetical protein ACOT81_19695 [Streptomyces sp. WI04-05B]|uniref:hypothetical protein n=1 Tax=Streptomyces TaxID=1883 RepID=UPI0029B97D44|nr:MULTISPECIES: hypothetical protein [unclassified Streptomyces]MDX2548844.1 hypothetical protein [Streptomyces sp. WI04-05B]MDX2590465.1 hypothetical protein [Streptomyces sp. WI04-05A]MDX3753779.1 hypothetical protein [Streptomyces sp. AK08-02]
MMPTVLWVFAAALTDLLTTCVLLRWIPAKHERLIPFVPFPLLVALALILRHAVGIPWPAALAACTGFLWGILLALLPFRGWISSWTLPVPREDRLRWYEVVLVVPAALTPLSTRRTDAALEKAFAPREVVRERGPFPLVMGVALSVLPVLGAAAARWAV